MVGGVSPTLRYFAFTLLLITINAISAGSTCYGTPSNGRLEGGVQLPFSGENFEAYGLIPWTLGRTHVHSAVRDVVVAAYARLADKLPDRVYQHAEAANELSFTHKSAGITAGRGLLAPCPA